MSIHSNFLLVLVFTVSVECKTCGSMDIRNKLENFKQLTNCTEIIGNLKILLVENFERGGEEFDNYVFPNLIKITGYLFFYKVSHLLSIGRMFPNLRVIRGVDLFTDYSLVLYDMPHLREIGTEKLMYIARGYVKVDKCPHLCFVNTVNWRTIGASGLHYTNMNNGTCDACPMNCEDHCWNVSHCQVTEVEKCHPECLGCSQNHSPKHCYACKNFEDEGVCVVECPKNRYVNQYSFKCVTEEECRTLVKGTWWIFKNECVNECPIYYEQFKDSDNRLSCRSCGQNCTKWCETEPIENMDRLQKLKGCTHINGSLIIKLLGVGIGPEMENQMTSDLETYLGAVKYIRDSLTVARTSTIKSFSFLQNLAVIDGQQLENVNNKYAIFVYENQKLQKLWNFSNFSLKITNGTIAFHNNPQLCLSEIDELAKITGLSNTPKNTTDVSHYSNGELAACNRIQMSFHVEVSAENATINWTQPTKTDKDTDSEQQVIGYTVFYKLTKDQDVDPNEAKDQCLTDGWITIFVRETWVYLKNLLPYSRYAYYVKIYRSNMVGTQSEVEYLKTTSDEPDKPDDIRVSALDDHTVELKWKPPLHTNGVLHHYTLDLDLIEDLQVFDDRDFCLQPRGEDGAGVDLEFNYGYQIKKTLAKTPKGNCSCSAENESEFEEKHTELGIMKLDIFMELCDLHAKSKFGFDKCKNHLYSVFPNENQTLKEDDIKLEKRGGTKMVEKPEPGRTRSSTLSTITIPANVTTYRIENLKHFRLYIFYFSACNLPVDKKKCGPIEQSFVRTKKTMTADDIDFVEITVDKADVSISWREPKNPNSFIVAYRVEYSKDSEHSKATTECLPRNTKTVGNYLKLTNLSPGKYIVSVRAESLAGLGRPTKPKVFLIEAPARNAAWIWAIVATFLMSVLVVLPILFYWYKRKIRLEKMHLIPSVNPDYEGVQYEEDEWELDRDDVELVSDLGQGTFGTVFCGFIKSKNVHCAVKTVNESLNLHERMSFLNEASVMKSFNKSHHVIRLLGVVSKGQPALVVMELMERGDLKKYLRGMRDSSQNITANEIYRMSIEIADGMAYLSAKKFVHRDLAARNCMVAQDRTVKIGDFGMTRDVYETDYYRKETKGLLPVRWMAPESLADGVFTTDSDVWSYGIVLWEIATLAEQPYQGLSNEQVLQFVTGRGKLKRPQECPDLLYEVMDACWCWKPNDRPMFSDIVERLEGHVGQDFKLVSFIHSREGLEHRLNHGNERAYNPPALQGGTRDYNLRGSSYNASDDDVSLYLGNSSRNIDRFLPSSFSQRRRSRLSSSSDFY